MEHHRHGLAGIEITNRAQAGLNFFGVVRIVVDEHEVGVFKAHVEAAAHTGISGQTEANLILRRTGKHCHSRCCHGVLYIVERGHSQFHVGNHTVWRYNVENILTILDMNVFCIEISFTVKRIRIIFYAFVGLMVEFDTLLDNHHAIVFHLSDKFGESLLNLGLVAIDVQMVGIHSANERNVWVERQERAVELIGFDHYPWRFGLDDNIGVEILAHTTQKGVHTNLRLIQNASGHC